MKPDHMNREDGVVCSGDADPIISDDDMLVSIIVPTRNSERYILTCLESIKQQMYDAWELIIIDNFSSDATLEIAREFTDKIYSVGPERSAQVNFGVDMAKGVYIFRVDSDFWLDPNVVTECVSLMNAGMDAVVVHNTPDVSTGLLARIRKFEVDMYKYSLDHTAARFMGRDLFLAVGGLREDVTAGEDYDFQNRLRCVTDRIACATSEAIHLDEPSRLLPLLYKYYRYGKDFHNYYRYNREESRTQLAFVRRDYIRHWREFLKHPYLGVMFVGYHILKYCAGGVGFCVEMVEQRTC